MNVDIYDIVYELEKIGHFINPNKVYQGKIEFAEIKSILMHDGLYENGNIITPDEFNKCMVNNNLPFRWRN